MINNLVQNAKIVAALSPVTNDAERTGDYIKLRDAGSLIVVVNMTQGDVAQSTVRVEQANTAAGGASKVLTKNMQIWANQNIVTNDTLTRQTDALNFQLSNAVANKLLVFQLDPSTLDVANGFIWVAVIAGVSNVANIVSANYYLVNHRYQQATPPTAII
jgi:hypothetical protein